MHPMDILAQDYRNQLMAAAEQSRLRQLATEGQAPRHTRWMAALRSLRYRLTIANRQPRPAECAPTSLH